MVDQALGIVATAAQFHRASILAVLAQIHLLHGNLAEAETALNQAKADPNRAALPIHFLPVILAEGELAVRQSDYARAVAIMDELLATLDQCGMQTYRSDALYIQGQALLAQGQPEAARGRLLEARVVAETIGSRRMAWQNLFALSQLESDPAEAQHLRHRAQEIVEDIADHTPTDLRDSFLGLPAVRAVM
jgi:tetratricopeptide (TPR) repeat protein